MISMIKPPMKNLKTLLTALSILAAATIASAQTPQARITHAIDNASRATIPGSLSPRALAANDIGAVPASTKLQGITLVFSRTPAQQSALDALVAAQQNPASPQYHQWLTPAQFGAQFGVAASDIAATEAWLQQQGFTIDGVSNSRDRIHFSGTEAQVESAFATQLHYFKSGAETHFAPASALSIPAALASTVLSVENLSDFRPRPQSVKSARAVRPNFTQAQSGGIALTPGDVATIYDINAAYSAGYTGAGQSIAIVGQSAIIPGDITAFQTAVGITPKAPNQVLVPGTGTSVINPFGAGDEGESDLDLEYSSSIAKGATIFFVYTGNSTNTNGVFTSVQYAIDENIAPIISESYGGCEQAQTTSFINQFNAILEQGAAQGQTIVNASGDSGSTDCFGTTGFTAAQQEAVAVDFPGSSQYVTAIGGSEFPPAFTASGNTTYFAAAGSSDVLSSAKSYIPEQVWNDDAVEGGPASGGGGTSIYTPRPSWQSGTIGGVSIPAGSFRLVPDVSLDASNYSAPYLFCSSDSSDWATQANGATPPYQESSCTSGLYDSYSGYLTAAGGTSFATPIFAGMVAIINQARGYTTGQGLINPTLYTLASNPTTYGSAFHDINTGGNQCLSGTSSTCSTAGAAVYAATTGYDEASGLGSVDLYKLLTAWPASSTDALIQTTTTLSAATTIPAVGVADPITINVTANTLPVATGTVTLTVDGVALPPLTLTAGVATYSFSSAAAGSHVIVATYAANGVYAASSSTLIISVGGSTSTGGSVTLTASNVTVAQGSSASSTLTLTPSGGYAGTFEFLTINAPTNLIDACVGQPANIVITGTAPGTSSIAIFTNIANCPSGSVPLVKGATGTFANGAKVRIIAGSAPAPSPSGPLSPATSGIAFAGLLLAGIFGRRSRKLRAGLAICILGVLGLALSGCSNGTVTAPPLAPKGTYQLSLTGADSVNTGVVATANFTLTID